MTTPPYEGAMPAGDYIDLAVDTGFFRPAEIDTLKEVILDYQKTPNTDYFFFDESEGGRLAGFIIFGRVPMTDHGWDIYWLAVNKSLQGRGIGRRLIARTEAFILLSDEKAIMRLETSGKAQYSSTREFYIRTGFSEAGAIPDFYTDGDALLNYYKAIRREQESGG
jgi:ribosomal protein S18 acetylase RimI-like enzyme